MYQGTSSEKIDWIIREMRKHPAHIDRFRERNRRHFEKALAEAGLTREQYNALPPEQRRGHSHGMMSEESFFDDEEDITIYLDFRNNGFGQKPSPEEYQQRIQEGNWGHGHKHEFFEMMYIYSGTCHCCIDGVDHVLHRGSIWIFNTQARHSVFLPDDESNLINILVRQSTFCGTMLNMVRDNDLFLNFFLNSIYNVDARPVHMKFQADPGGILEHYIFRLIEEYYQSQPYCQSILKHIFSCLLIELTRQYRASLPDPEEGNRQSLSISHVISYISDHCTDVTLQSTAEHFHYTTNYISKFILKHTGRSFSEIVSTFKMEKSAQWLTTTEFPLERIASMTGYSERSSFEKVFKKHYGITPSKYRKQNQPVSSRAR